MCRSIKTLRQSDVPATDDEIRAAALQYVRKISGFRHPTKRHEAAFESAVDEVSEASQRLLDAVTATLRGGAESRVAWRIATPPRETGASTVVRVGASAAEDHAVPGNGDLEACRDAPDDRPGRAGDRQRRCARGRARGGLNGQRRAVPA